MKHMRHILLLLALLLPQALAGQDDSNTAFAQGNAAYARAEKASGGDADLLYEEAARHYMDALREGDSWVLHYNLGNALHGMKEYGPAVLHYERALAINPGHPEIAANLTLTRRQAGMSGLDDRNYAVRWALNLPLSAWAVIAAGCGWAALALIVLPPLFRGYSPLSIGLALLCLVGLVAAGVGLLGWHLRAQRHVVLIPGTPLLAAPIADSSSIRELPATTYVLPQRSYQTWTYVQTEDGDHGWIASKSAEPIWK